MPGNKSSEPPPHLQKRKKKKKRQKADSSSSPKDADKPHPALPVPPVLPTISPPRPPPPGLKSTPKQGSEKGGRRKRSPASLLSLLGRSGASPVQSFLSRLSGPARESVRWEGALDDPLKEEQRLEVYRANRRQRYVRHREMEQSEAEHET
ncbi:protein LIAT1 [Eucyclogobius newberryi]|uniref:protein LIAT1 n=1 Tax=Eucyclogobius newberryi TaxID=166745 RepID=UPI003B5C2B04